MIQYFVEITPSAVKDYRKIPQRDAKKITAAIDALASDPRPHNCKKLENRDAYRIRIGDYRVIYEINARIITVSVIRIRHRKEVYKDF